MDGMLQEGQGPQPLQKMVNGPKQELTPINSDFGTIVYTFYITE